MLTLNNEPDFTRYDPVAKPKHYMLFPEEGIEVRDVLRVLVDKIEDQDRMWCSDYVQMMQYVMRFAEKNGKQDLEKARFYLNKMIDEYA